MYPSLKRSSLFLCRVTSIPRPDLHIRIRISGQSCLSTRLIQDFIMRL